MILYVDTSALVKRYVVEVGTPDVNHWIELARPTSTASVARTETTAAICRATRLGWIQEDEGQHPLDLFRSEWELFGRLPITEATVRRADDVACRHGLRGYDAVHLACALTYQEGLGIQVTLLTFNRALWRAGRFEELLILPETLH